MVKRNTPQTEEILFQSLDFIPIPILLSESHINQSSGKIQRIHRFMNRAFIEQIGYTITDIPDIDAWFNTVYPDAVVRQAMIDGWEAEVKRSLAAGIKTAEMQARIRCGNGEFRWFVITAQISTDNLSDLHVVTMRDIHDLQTLIEENARLSYTDMLTGLANRREAEKVLTQLIIPAHQTDAKVSLLMCDVDFFKTINDTYGHLCGDEVLVQIATTLEKFTHQASCIARWGGEEFLIILRHSSLDIAYQLAEDIRCEIASTSFHYQEHQLNLTVSLGCVSVQHNESARSALYRVDKALYRAKLEGRNRVMIG